MKLLAFDSTAKTASVALFEDGRLRAEMFADNGKTHSEILLPMAEDIASRAHTPLSEIDFYAVAAGPGSFTGVRIGVATVKGLAFSYPEEKKNCVSVSALEAIAEGLAPLDGIYTAVMDARRNEVYNALFCVKDGVLTRLCPDRALSLSALGEELCAKYADFPIRLAGDGYEVAKRALSAFPLRIEPTSERLAVQSAVSVGRCALRAIERGEIVTASVLAPTYLRLPQAERDRIQKEKEQR